MKIIRFSLIFFLFSIITSSTNGFAQYALRAQYSETRWNEYVAFVDANKNGKIESYETFYEDNKNNGIIVKEWKKDFTYVTIDTLKYYGIVYYAGDINNNGLIDIVIQTGDIGFGGNGYLQVWEQETPTSLPTRKIDQLTFPERKVLFFAQYVDLNQDGRQEILLSRNGFFVGDISIYEWDTNANKLILKWSYGPTNELDKKAVGDFDNDGVLEFAFGDPGWIDFGGRSSLDANTAKNRHKEIIPGVYTIQSYSNESSLPTNTIGNARIHIFKYINDTTYQEIWDYDCGWKVSTTGPSFSLDYDGDSTQEFVSSFSVFHNANDRFTFLLIGYKNDAYQVLYDIGDPSTKFIGLTIGIANDFDQDGQDEIIASTQPYTRVYDFEYGEGSGSWFYTELWDSTGFGYYAPDINHNGYPDLYLILHSSQERRLHIYESINAPTGIIQRTKSFAPKKA
ncbi:MAG: VCBS repeat-containing protein, partial [Parcubacteria group bacterium]|nr:VCBS repeat-containing protein [Parcubacteria group bacterium]